MRRWTLHTTAGLAFLVPFALGCNLIPGIRNQVKPPAVITTTEKPTVDSLVEYLNNEAARVQNLRSSVDIQVKAPRQPSIGLDGLLAAQRPRQFRLKATFMGKSACDIGSNDQEFWYWISQDKPPYLYHCSYSDFATGKVNVPFPFQPDMVISALGIAEYDTKAKYEMRERPTTWELVQATTTGSGQSVVRITAFNKRVAEQGRPQVVEHALLDTKGKVICRASIDGVQELNGSKIPSVVTIEWPTAELSMTLKLRRIETNRIDTTVASSLFSRSGLQYEPFDLARGRNTTSSLQQTGLTTPRTR